MPHEPEDEWVERMLAQRAEEDATAKRRYEAQLQRADLTPMYPSPGTWLTESHWQPISGWDNEPAVLLGSDTIREAVHEGLQQSCCSGVLRVRVIGPDGRVHASYDREGNYWLRHTAEAEEDERAHRASFDPGTTIPKTA